MRGLLLAILVASACVGQALLVSRPLQRTAQPRQHAVAAVTRSSLPVLCDAPAVPAEPEPETAPSPIGRARAWLGKWAKFDKDMLKTLGVDAFFTCAPPPARGALSESAGLARRQDALTLVRVARLADGVVSNINAAFTVALAWGTFSKASGLSPLAPGQWSKFLATYVGIYATLGSLLRPFRFALAVGATPLYTKVITGVRDALPFRKTRPALNRTLALVLVSLFLNAAGTCGIIAVGCWGAGVVTGVPAFPPGWKRPF